MAGLLRRPRPVIACRSAPESGHRSVLAGQWPAPRCVRDAEPIHEVAAVDALAVAHAQPEQAGELDVLAGGAHARSHPHVPR
ncbi:hypothetical protein WME91_32835 [Sorangium sp. So ce269]